MPDAFLSWCVILKDSSPVHVLVFHRRLTLVIALVTFAFVFFLILSHDFLLRCCAEVRMLAFCVNRNKKYVLYRAFACGVRHLVIRLILLL